MQIVNWKKQIFIINIYSQHFWINYNDIFTDKFFEHIKSYQFLGLFDLKLFINVFQNQIFEINKTVYLLKRSFHIKKFKSDESKINFIVVKKDVLTQFRSVSFVQNFSQNLLYKSLNFFNLKKNINSFTSLSFQLSTVIS